MIVESDQPWRVRVHRATADPEWEVTFVGEPRWTHDIARAIDAAETVDDLPVAEIPGWAIVAWHAATVNS